MSSDASASTAVNIADSRMPIALSTPSASIAMHAAGAIHGPMGSSALT
jgi:hypothetical protein